MAGKALREARQDNNSDCTLIVAPRVTGSVREEGGGRGAWMLKALRTYV